MSFVGIADVVEGFPVPSGNVCPTYLIGVIIGLRDRKVSQLAQGIRHFRGESRGLFVDVADGAIVAGDITVGKLLEDEDPLPLIQILRHLAEQIQQAAVPLLGAGTGIPDQLQKVAGDDPAAGWIALGEGGPF